jgi:hypothetical protein
LQSTGGQDATALDIVLNLLIVHRAIYFYDQAGGVAVKVHDEAINDLLAAEVKSVQAVSP